MEILALFVTFGAENCVRGPVVLLTEEVQNLRLDGLLTLKVITHGNLGANHTLPGANERKRKKMTCSDIRTPALR